MHSPKNWIWPREPLDRDVEGSTIELDGLYDGLESGRWIIVSGNRTDITDSTGATNATGVVGNELVMISQVTQGPGKQSCMPLTVDAVPFSNVYGVIGPLTTTTSGYPDTVGDMLIVGAPNAGFVQFLQSFPLPNTPSGNQEICAPLQLAPGLYADTYLPTSAERNGDFTPFSGLIDPLTGKTFSGTLPAASVPNSPPAGLCLAHFSLASGNDTRHDEKHLVEGFREVHPCKAAPQRILRPICSPSGKTSPARWDCRLVQQHWILPDGYSRLA